MYIGTVGVIPELLVISGNRTKAEEFKDGIKQLIAMFVGIGLMTYPPLRRLETNKQGHLMGISHKGRRSSDS
jgi:hypothetical protein